MFTIKQKALPMFPIGEISLHENIPKELTSAHSGMSYFLKVQTEVTLQALQILLLAHPVIATKLRTGRLVCIGGLRSYQLAQTRLSPRDKVPVLLIEDIQPHEIPEIAKAETYLTHLAFGLEGKAWDIDFSRLWESLSVDNLRNLTPGIRSKRKLAQYLGTNRLRFSSNPPPLESSLNNQPSVADREETKSDQ